MVCAEYGRYVASAVALKVRCTGHPLLLRPMTSGSFTARNHFEAPAWKTKGLSELQAAAARAGGSSPRNQEGGFVSEHALRDALCLCKPESRYFLLASFILIPTRNAPGWLRVSYYNEDCIYKLDSVQ